MNKLVLFALYASLTAGCARTPPASGPASVATALPAALVGTWSAPCKVRPQNGFGYTLTLNADGSGTLTTDGYGDTVCGSNDTRSVLALTVGIVASSSTSPPVYEITWTQQGISNMPLNQRGLAYLRKSSKTCDGSAFQVNVASPSKCFFSGPYYDLRSVAGQNMYVDETSDSNAPVAIRAIDKSYYYVKLSQ